MPADITLTELIQSKYFYFIYLKSNLILSFHLHLDLPSGLFLQVYD
jgi:hypothetical protein